MTISQRIFFLLHEKHLSQKDLAQYAGLSPAAISGWKTKNTSPSADKLVKICEFLDVSLSYLLTGSDTPVSTSECIMDKSTPYQADMTKYETELLRMFRLLPELEKGRFLGVLEQTLLKYANSDVE